MFWHSFQLSSLFLNILSQSVSKLFFKLICVSVETSSRISNCTVRVPPIEKHCYSRKTSSFESITSILNIRRNSIICCEIFRYCYLWFAKNSLFFARFNTTTATAVSKLSNNVTDIPQISKNTTSQTICFKKNFWKKVVFLIFFKLIIDHEFAKICKKNIYIYIYI
jgi:hypothetical protein